MYNKNFDTAPNTNITPRDVSRALRRKRFGNFCARHYGIMILALVLAALMIVSVGCQMAEDFKGGLAHITGKETEPPSAFTPTVTPEPEPAPEPDTKPTVIMMEEVTTDEGECETCRDAEKNTVEPREDAIEFAKAIVEEFYYGAPLYAQDVKYAAQLTEDDFVRIVDNAELPIDLYTGIPYNMFVAQNGRMLTNKEYVALIGEELAQRYVDFAQYISTVNYMQGIKLPGGFIRDTDMDLLDPNFAEAFSNMIKTAKAKRTMKQFVFASTDLSMIYKDGDGHIRVRVLTDTNLIKSERGTKSDVEGKWLFTVDDVILDVWEDGTIHGVEFQPVTATYLTECNFKERIEPLKKRLEDIET